MFKLAFFINNKIIKIFLLCLYYLYRNKKCSILISYFLINVNLKNCPRQKTLKFNTNYLFTNYLSLI